MQAERVKQAMARGRRLMRALAKATAGLVIVLVTAGVLFTDLTVVGGLSLIAVMLAMGSYWWWLTYAMCTLRPAIAEAFGKFLGVRVVEGGGVGFDTAGQWEIVGKPSWWLRLSLPICDISVLIALVIVPFAMGALPLIYVLNGFHF